jgi:preprotein translocase subunit SecA
VHQAVEAQEELPPTPADGPAARITVQDLFLRYPQRAGMSGTAAEDRREFRRVFGLPVHVVPCHRPVRRSVWTPRVFVSGDAKLAAVVAETAELHRAGRPVLIGTRSIDKSERLSMLLAAAGLAHQVLNAQREAEEAEIVKEAGGTGRVTVATNMAGRGTDIKLPAGVVELGGLHVIGTEMHESARIDRQLFGRCARQGDAGSCRQYVALDDELLAAGWGRRRAAQIAAQFPDRAEAPRSMLALFHIAQRRVQRRHRTARERLLFREREQQQVAEQLGFDYHLDLFES